MGHLHSVGAIRITHAFDEDLVQRRLDVLEP
jgi:hypothetical protein